MSVFPNRVKGHNRPWMRPYFLTFCTKGRRRRAEQFWPFSKGQSSLYNKAEQKGNCTTIHTVCCVPSWPITSHYWKAMRPSSVRLMIGIAIMINLGLFSRNPFVHTPKKERKEGDKSQKKSKKYCIFPLVKTGHVRKITITLMLCTAKKELDFSFLKWHTFCNEDHNECNCCVMKVAGV